MSMSAEYDFLFEDIDEPKPDAIDAPEQDDAEAEAERERAAQTVAAEAQEKALTAEVDRYLAMLPAIETARPLPAQTDAQEPDTPRLSGAAWVADRLHKAIDPVAPSGTRITTGVVGTTVAATVIPPAGVKGKPLASAMLAAIDSAGNLGGFTVVRAGGSAFTLRRDGVGVETDAWTRHGSKAARFHDEPASRPAVWDAAGLSVAGSTKGKKRRPKVVEFGEDARGGTVELRLPDGLTIANVERARAALRQSLNAPALEVSARGVHPVLHLNTKAIAAEFPKVNPLRPAMLIRPRNQAERHAAASEFVLPLGVRADGAPILIRQDVAPHMGIFGGTGQGKTVLLSQMVKAAVLQGAEVILADAKNGKDLRRIALERLPGVVHYSSNSEAGLHRVAAYCRDELERRKVLAAALQQRGIEYTPTPLLLVFDEVGAWLDDAISGTDKAAREAAQATIVNLSYVAAQAREQRVFLLVAGQHAYVSAFSGRWKSNTSTLVVLGPPTDNHRQALFTGEQREQVRELGSQISKAMKGRGLVADTETGEVVMFQGFFNPAGEAADRFDAEVHRAPKLRRFAWRFPRGDVPGGDGSWQGWTPATDPSSDSLPVQILDRADGTPDPAAAVFDPISSAYRPGRKPLSDAHQNAN
ncbi:FtsK/SpoIIIE domain-containing protein [Tsukamurella paurometabola]|uniref:Type IV secretion system DNA-binding domain-containing protein n=1 Tax=Tsukamurella paurometabola TaxID=2061 RepID=A0ABS5NG74_TSUPA|nr:FtsK/SpoIIIE domain-containing protein [Tsukamurella paurometabola]MBS4102933.1 type IV secretion system DNA-binding domain-containing protein [Tsukamurella paurometabola]